MANLSTSLFKNVVQNNFCIGCGACAGVCPRHYIHMKMGVLGIYQPEIIQICEMKQCNLCATSCPFWNQSLDETVLAQKIFHDLSEQNFDNSLGTYTNLISGHVNDEEARMNSASGGLATWVLEELLLTKEVDHVICVTATANTDVFYRFSVFSDIESLKTSSGSCYYPVQFADMIQYILANPGNYAITGLPCYIKSLRLIMLRNQKFSKRVKYLVGLVCGQTQNKYFIDYLYSLAGGNPKDITRIKFRIKDPGKPANNYGIRFSTREPKTSKELFWNEGMGEAWLKGYFRPKACDFCDDVFAELADVTFMDAWLPEFVKDSAGTNLVVVRSKKIEELLIQGNKKGTISIAQISPEEIKQSQQGVIFRKKDLLATRLALSRARGYLPQKRVAKKRKVSLRTFINYQFAEWIRKSGGEAVSRSKDDLYLKINQETAFPKKVFQIYKKVEKLIIRIINPKR